MYKVAMKQGDVWNVLATGESYDKMLRELESYREVVGRREFRLEKHTVEVIDV